SSEQQAMNKAELLAKLYRRIGTKQLLLLRQALTELFRRDVQSGSEGFGFSKLDKHLELVYQMDQRSPDGLIEVTSKLRLLHPFLDEGEGQEAPLIGGRFAVRLNELASETLP